MTPFAHLFGTSATRSSEGLTSADVFHSVLSEAAHRVPGPLQVPGARLEMARYIASAMTQSSSVSMS